MTVNLKQKWASPTYARHVAELKRRGITLEQAILRGYEPLSAKETWAELHQHDLRDADTIAFTCFKGDGTKQPERRYCVIDPEIRKATGKRYTQRGGTGSIIHIRQPATQPKKGKRVIYGTEGEFKADTLFEVTRATSVSIPGVRSFLKDGAIHPDLAALKLGKGDVFKFVYDTDQTKNADVITALFRFADLLAADGVTVKFVDLRPVPNLAKTGVDDAVQHFGPDALLKATEHDFDSDWAATWRAAIAKTQATDALPPLNLGPVSNAWFDKPLPPVEFLVDGYLTRNIVALLVAEGGAGKTNLALHMAESVAGGEDFFGLKTQLGRVAFFALEDPPDVLQRRVHRVYQDRLTELRFRKDKGREAKYDANVRRNLTVISLVGQQLHIIGMKGGVVVQSGSIEELIAHLKAEGIEFLILDPMARLHGADENGNAIGTAIINAAERIAREVGCTILISHHTGKANAVSKNETAYAARGSSGISDAARSVLRLREIDDKEAEAIKNVTDEEQRRGVMRLVHAKNNYGPKLAELWLKRGEFGGFTSFFPEFKDGADGYAEFITGLRAWATANPAPFTTNTVVKEKRELIFDSKIGRNEAAKFFDQAVRDGALKMTDKKLRGGGSGYVISGGAQ